MYLRKVERRYKGRLYVHYYLVESVHTSRGPRQRTVYSLGDLKPKSASEWLALFKGAVDALSEPRRITPGIIAVAPERTTIQTKHVHP